MKNVSRFVIVFFSITLIGSVGFVAYAQKAAPTVVRPQVVVGGEENDPNATPTAGLANVHFNEMMLAKREAAMDALERLLQEQLDDLIAEHQRRVKEMKEWRAKERAKLAK